MLVRHSWRHGAKRNCINLQYTTTKSRRPFFIKPLNSGGRDKTGRRHHLGKWQRSTPVRGNLWTLLLPGRVIKFCQPDNYKIWAIVQTYFGWKTLLPAVRGMQLYQSINTQQLELGSFIKASRLRNRQLISNVVVPNKHEPSYLRAPGTYARIQSITQKLQLQLTRRRLLTVDKHAIVQLGANAAHDHRRTTIGGAGTRRLHGCHPHVRMQAKNPVHRVSLRHRIKQYNWQPRA